MLLTHLPVRKLASLFGTVRDTELRVIATLVTSHRQEGRLRTQDRHEANGVSNVRTVRKRACLCGVCRGEQLLTLNDRSLARQVNTSNGAKSFAFSGGEMK